MRLTKNKETYINVNLYDLNNLVVKLQNYIIIKYCVIRLIRYLISHLI